MVARLPDRAIGHLTKREFGYFMILVFASSKGGVGKSTACAAIGAALALRGERVLIVDLDPNQTLARWGKKVKTKGLSIEAVPPTDFTSYLSRQVSSGQFEHILVDLMGSREATMLKALARADLVIIPAQTSEPDLREALVVIGDVRDMAETRGGPIPFRVLLTKLYPLRTRVTDFAYGELARLNLPYFKTTLVERTAYREMLLSGEPASRIEPKKGAGAEIGALIKEIEAVLAKTASPAKTKRKKAVA